MLELLFVIGFFDCLKKHDQRLVVIELLIATKKGGLL